MSDLRSGPLAAWTRAWVSGAVSLDEVVDAVTGDDAPHVVLGDGPGATFDHAPLRDLLVAWRLEAAPVRTVLPASGDVRGLPGPPVFRAAAIDTGEAVVCGGLGVVPEVVEYHPSSAPATVTWHLYATAPAPPDHQDVIEAQYELTTAIRESASVLAAADVGRWRDEIADLLTDARHAGDHVNLPPGYPSRAVAMLAQALRMQAVLDLAAGDPVGGAVDQHGIGVRAEALRPLATAVRRARLTAYNATA